jgi:hypothetical protein
VLVEHLCYLAYSGIVVAPRERWSETARRFNPAGEAECQAAYGTPERSHGTPSASNPSRKKAPKIPPRIQNAGRLI